MDFPALVMAGEEDPKFTAIARELAAGLPRATFSMLPECGHTPHVENPRAFLGAVANYFSGL
jgi:pimeloyl-ACP methyl ester carboxylesterase